MVNRFRRIYLKEVDSTQRYLKSLYESDPNLPLTLVWTTHQTAGYGRKGTPWIAPPSKSLPFSFLDRPQEPLSLWSARIALSLYDTVKPYCQMPLYLKWPNDLYTLKGKLAGILIEAQWQGTELTIAFAGIGLNVYETSFPAGLWATSIEASGYAPPSCQDLLDAFEAEYFRWKGTPSPYVEVTFTQRLWCQGPFRIGGAVVEGTLRRWNSNGTLLLDTPQGPLLIEGHQVEMVWPPPAWPST